MPAVQVSRFLRLNLEARFGVIFNDALADACEEFGIADLVYNINFDQAPSAPQNFFRGNRSLDNLLAMQEPTLPGLAMWVGEGAEYTPGQREMPRVFSGAVFAHWRFFLSVKGLRNVGLTDLREATEAAMVTTIAPEFSGVNYRSDLAWQALDEQLWRDEDQEFAALVQVVEYQASFGVNI